MPEGRSEPEGLPSQKNQLFYLVFFDHWAQKFTSKGCQLWNSPWTSTGLRKHLRLLGRALRDWAVVCHRPRGEPLRAGRAEADFRFEAVLVPRVFPGKKSRGW